VFNFLHWEILITIFSMLIQLGKRIIITIENAFWYLMCPGFDFSPAAQHIVFGDTMITNTSNYNNLATEVLRTLWYYSHVWCDWDTFQLLSFKTMSQIQPLGICKILQQSQSATILVIIIILVCNNFQIKCCFITVLDFYSN